MHSKLTQAVHVRSGYKATGSFTEYDHLLGSIIIRGYYSNSTVELGRMSLCFPSCTKQVFPCIGIHVNKTVYIILC